MLTNSKGKIFYGIHFYPGLAQYHDLGEDPYKVFLNEDTLRKMDASFAGKPIFVEHVDEVEQNLDVLRGEADGWVIESFYNASDGKHWVKFIVVSELGERAIQSGMRLSNAYMPKASKPGGVWNGIPYLKEIVDAEYEHLAIVRKPRYEESIILTPEQFKTYNENQVAELKKISNSNDKEQDMKFNFFKRTKVENTIDPEMQVQMPSGKFVSVSTLISDAVARDEKATLNADDPKSHAMANLDDMVKMHDGGYMKVKDMVSQHKAMRDEMEDMKASKSEMKEEVDPPAEEKNEGANKEPKEELKTDDDGGDMGDTAAMQDSEDKDDKDKNPLQKDSEDEEEMEAAKKKTKNEAAKIKAERLRNAPQVANLKNALAEKEETIELASDQVKRGKARYGSG